MKDIQYPYALDAMRSKRSIRDEDAPKPFWCGDCNEEMIAKRGKRNRWHFAHKGIICTPKPDPDNFLHRLAQEKIVAGFHSAQQDSTEYRLGCRCACGQIVSRNIALARATIGLERTVVEGTRSDIVATMADGKSLIIEVVNTHPPDEVTEARYKASKLPVFIRHVNWDSIDDLDTEVLANRMMNPSSVECSACKKRRRQEQEERRRARETFDRGKKVIDASLRHMERRRSSTPWFKPWYAVSKPNWTERRSVEMFPWVQRRVFANAVILTELGFRQHNTSKPHLFRYSIGKNPTRFLYADLGGSDVIPIYEDTSALLYIPDLEDEPDLEQYVISVFGERLQKNGAEVRTGFESTATLDQKDTDPTRYVRKTVIDSMINWDSWRRHKESRRQTTDKRYSHVLDESQSEALNVVTRRTSHDSLALELYDRLRKLSGRGAVAGRAESVQRNSGDTPITWDTLPPLSSTPITIAVPPPVGWTYCVADFDCDGLAPEGDDPLCEAHRDGESRKFT